jgi:hypothetical protein
VTVEEFILVKNPRQLGVSRLPAQRVPLGVPGDYKPCVAQLLGGELVLVAFNQQRESRWREGLPAGRWREDLLLFRSQDGGITWSPRQIIPGLLGREPYLTVLKDGTVLMTTHFNYDEIRNEDGYLYSYLHRSSDGGRTWQSLRIDWRDVPGTPPPTTLPGPFINAWTVTSRNVLELADGGLVLGVSSWTGLSYLWRSHDGGQTWDPALSCRFVDEHGGSLPRSLPHESNGGFPRMDEAVFWPALSGDLLGLFRVDSRLFAPLPGTQVPAEASDHYTRMLVFRSPDGGRNWQREKELGSDYGEMYPSLLRLREGRLLLTFTVRARRPLLGVQAVLGREQQDGLAFDFEQDRLVLDARTPLDKPSGGGFGPTVQLADGTLVTAYSYRGQDDQTHLEVVRWNLPPG